METYIFYKIVCLDENIKSCYVGSSKSYDDRKRCHKKDCHNENGKHYNLKVYQFIRDNGGWDNFQFIVLEEKGCDREEALWIERKYIEELNCDLNTTHKPIATKEELKEYVKEYNKEYYQKNKDKIKEYYNEYHKEYYERNKDNIKEHYERNKDKINEKIICECGSIVSRRHLARHIKTKKHQLFISNELI